VNLPLSEYAVSLADIENIKEEAYNPDNRLVQAITSEILADLKEISSANRLVRDVIVNLSIQTGGSLFKDHPKLADFAAHISSANKPSDLQAVLESLVIEERLHKALIVLKAELAGARLQKEISEGAEANIAKGQEEYIYREQLKFIRKKLGIDTDGKEKLVEKFKARAAELKMPDEVKKVFDEVCLKADKNFFDVVHHNVELFFL